MTSPDEVIGTRNADRVLINESDLAVIERLRKIRNAAQHGRKTEAPEIGDLQRAWSIVARLITYRLGNTSLVGED